MLYDIGTIMNTETDSNWIDRSLSDVLDETDRRTYYNDRYRQPPKLTRRQAAEAEAEERRQQFIRWLMTDKFGEFRPFADRTL